MKRWFQAAWADVRHGENVDGYAVIVIALVVGTLSAFGVTSVAVSLAVLLAAAAIMTSQGLRVLATVKAMKTTDQHKMVWLTDRFYAEHISRCRRISMLSVANYRYLGANNDAFYTCLARGAEVRALLLDPQSNWGSRTVRCRSVGSSTESRHIPQHHNLTVGKLREFSRLGAVSVRKTMYPPAHVINWLEFDNEPSLIFVIPSGFQHRTDARPTLQLGEHDDARAFEYFKSYFENLWNWDDSRPVQLS